MQPPAMYENCPLELTEDIWLVGNYFFNQYLIRGTRACALVEMGVTAVVDAAIAQTQDIDLGGLTLRCLPVIGHSPGNLAIHVPEREVLLVSDSLGVHYPGRVFCPLFFTGLAAFRETLAKEALFDTVS